MTTELSEADAQKLFNEIAAANGDQIKLDALLATPADTTNVVVTEEEPKVVTEEVVTPAEKTEVVTEEVVTTKEEEAPVVEKQPEDISVVTDPNEDPKLKELREQLEKLSKENHALKSQAGRVPHVQRKLKELDQKLEELNQKAASPSNHPSAAIQPKVLEKLKGIRETDPELADAIAAAFAEAIPGLANDAINRERETLTLLREQEQKAYQAEQVQILLDRFPNAAEVVASTSWSEWKKEQSEDVLRLAESDHADGVALAFELYARDMKAKHPALAQQTAQVAVVTAKPTDADAAKAAQIEEERRRKQATAATVGSPNAPGKVSLPDDPEALFKKYSDEIRKQRTG